MKKIFIIALFVAVIPAFVLAEVPEYDENTQYLEKSYYVQDGKIYEKYEIKQIITEDSNFETEEII